MTLICKEDLQIVKNYVSPKKGKYCLRDKQVNIIKSLVIPVNLNEGKVPLITEVVEGNIPWLGKRTKKVGTILNIGRGVRKVSDLGHMKVRLREDRRGGS